MKKWTQKEMDTLDLRGSVLFGKNLAIRAIAEKLQAKYFKGRSVESVRHKVRELVS